MAAAFTEPWIDSPGGDRWNPQPLRRSLARGSCRGLTLGFREGGGRAKGVRFALKVFTRLGFFDRRKLEMEPGAADGDADRFGFRGGPGLRLDVSSSSSCRRGSPSDR